MNKRIASVILAFILIIGLLPINVLADLEPVVGYMPVYLAGKKVKKDFVILKHQDEFFMEANDISVLTGYHYEQEEGTWYEKTSNLEPDTIVHISEDGSVQAMGKEYQITILQHEGKIFYPLEKVLYLLHAQWITLNGILCVVPMSPSLIEFLHMNFLDIYKNRTNQTALLINDEKPYSFALKSSMSVIFNNIDMSLFVDIFPRVSEEGVSAGIVRKQFKEAMLQLASTDGEFLGEDRTKKIQSSMEESYFSQAKSNFGVIIDGLDFIKTIGGDASFLEMSAYGGISELAPFLAENGKYFDYGLDGMEYLLKINELSHRSKTWSEEFIKQIQILKDFENPGYYDGWEAANIGEAANDILMEYINPDYAVLVEAAETMAAKALEVAISPLEKVFSLVDAAVTYLKQIPAADSFIALGDFAYMVNSLIQLEDIAVHEMDAGYEKLTLKCLQGNLTEEDIEHLRNSTTLALKTKLRNKIFIYFLNQKWNKLADWEQSEEAKNLEAQISDTYIKINQLMTTDETDRLLVLDSFENMYSHEYGKMRTKIPESLFIEGEISSSYEISEYFNSISQFVEDYQMTDMEGGFYNNAYEKEKLLLSYANYGGGDESYQITNEGNENILLYGIKLGDNLKLNERILQNNGFESYLIIEKEYGYSEHDEYQYVSKENGAFLSMNVDDNGNIKSWMVMNHPEGLHLMMFAEKLMKDGEKFIKSWDPVYESFMLFGAYREQIGDEWTEEDILYTVTDINDDGTNELMIEAREWGGFVNTWIFSKENGKIDLIHKHYGYGEFRYSPSQNAVLASPEVEPFGGTSSNPFYQLNGDQFVYKFQVGEDMGACYYADETSKKSITEKEMSKYFSDVVRFDWRLLGQIEPGGAY